jgi:hypothetical protein
MRYSHLIPAFIIGLSLAGSASASYIGTSPLIPPLDGMYVAPSGSATSYGGGVYTVVVQNIIQENFLNIIPTPITGGTSETFTSTIVGVASLNGGPSQPLSLTGLTTVKILNNYTPGMTGTFATEMLGMDLSGDGVMIRESPTRSSLGQTTITDIGGGEYRIDSFFDIFTEISPNGLLWFPAAASTHVDLVPEPASLGVMGLGAMLLLYRRRAR